MNFGLLLNCEKIEEEPVFVARIKMNQIKVDRKWIEIDLLISVCFDQIGSELFLVQISCVFKKILKKLKKKF